VAVKCDDGVSFCFFLVGADRDGREYGTHFILAEISFVPFSESVEGVAVHWVCKNPFAPQPTKNESAVTGEGHDNRSFEAISRARPVCLPIDG
jgi:hypothetical protein